MQYRGTISYRVNAGGVVPEGFCFSLIQAYEFLNRNFWLDCGTSTGSQIENTPPKNFYVMRSQHVFPDEGANFIAETFLGDWVLMLDTDHVFAQDALLEMVTTFETESLDVLVGFTQKRFPPYHPVIYKTAFDPYTDFETIFPNALERQMLIPIDSSGAACLMVRRRVFDEIKRSLDAPPFARLSKVPLSVDIHERYNTFGEDTSFFKRVKQCGFQAYCAPWIKFHHLAQVMVTENMIVSKPDESPIPQ